MKRHTKQSEPRPRPEEDDPNALTVEQSQHGAGNPDGIDVRAFILSRPSPPAVYGEQLLEALELVLTPEQRHQFLLQHRFPPVWGQEMEAEIQGWLERAGFNHVRCQCLCEHPVIQIRMRKTASRQLSLRELKRLLREMAKDLGKTITGGVVASVQTERVEATLVMQNPDLIVEPVN